MSYKKILFLKNKFFRLYLPFICLLIFSYSYTISQISNDIHIEHSAFLVNTIHGNLTVRDPLIIELIKSPAMQRLKNIRQYGTTDYVLKHKTIYTRFDHSLGVYYILCKHGASRAEQVAGLLHDISHTVFSHACDPLFMGNLTKGAYQDTIHEEFLEHYGIKDILAKYGFTIADVLPKNKHFRALEQEAPALCADRIEYNIYAAYMDDLLSKNEIKEIQHGLHFDGDNWYFDDAQVAKKFALISLHQTVYMWGGPHNILINNWTCEALKQALDIGLIKKEDILYNLTDDQMWKKLNECTDPVIISTINKIMHCNLLFSWPRNDEKDFAVTLKAKFRGVDPFVKTCNGLVLLSNLDADFKKSYELVKKTMQTGWNVILHSTPTRNVSSNYLDPRLELGEIVLLQNNSNIFLSDIAE